MHSWETLYTVTGKRHRGRPVSLWICRGCGMIWNSSTRRPVPICWHRYVKPHWRDWWDRFQAGIARLRADRVPRSATEQQKQNNGPSAPQDPRPGRLRGRFGDGGAWGGWAGRRHPAHFQPLGSVDQLPAQVREA